MKATGCRIDIQYIAIETLNKDSVRRIFKQVTEPLLALAQRFLRPLALGDVQNLRHCPHISGRVLNHGGADLHPPLLTVLSDDVKLVPGRNLLPLLSADIAVCNELSALIIKEPLKVLANDLLTRIPQDAAQFVVHVGELVSIIYDNNPRGRVFHHGTIPLLTLAQRLLRPLALGDVAPNRLELGHVSLCVEHGPVDPLLPAHLAPGRHRPVLYGRHRLFPAERGQVLDDPLPVLRQNLGRKAMPHQILTLLTVMATIGLVHKGKRAVGEKATNQVRLILDDGAVAFLTLPQRLLRPYPFLLQFDVAQGEGDIPSNFIEQ